MPTLGVGRTTERWNRTATADIDHTGLVTGRPRVVS